MDKQYFDQLVKSVKTMKRHLADKPVRDIRATELPAPGLRSSAKSQKSGRTSTHG